jgi:hypothetical protein
MAIFTRDWSQALLSRLRPGLRERFRLIFDCLLPSPLLKGILPTGSRALPWCTTKGSPAALVTYATQNDKISLLIDSSKSAVVAGGDEVRFDKLTFHYYNNLGFRVITWNNHGLSYALVSSVSGPARTSCLVCHQNMADSSNFKTHQ